MLRKPLALSRFGDQLLLTIGKLVPQNSLNLAKIGQLGRQTLWRRTTLRTRRLRVCRWRELIRVRDRVPRVIELPLKFVDPLEQLVPVEVLSKRSAQFDHLQCRGTNT